LAFDRFARALAGRFLVAGREAFARVAVAFGRGWLLAFGWAFGWALGWAGRGGDIGTWCIGSIGLGAGAGSGVP
jgi:hypothetical protein